MKSPGVVSESPCSVINDSSSSTATAPSGGSSFNQSPGSFCAQSPPSGQRIPGRQNASPISPRGPHAHLFDMASKLMAESDQQLQKLPKSPKGNRLKGGTGTAAGQGKNKLNNQSQMNLSFSNALEFQQLLASKYGTGTGNTGTGNFGTGSGNTETGNFPASNLLTAAAKAQGNHSNPLTQALTQLQQGLTHCKGPKGKGKKSAKAAAAAAGDGGEAAAPGGKKDDFHASSFLVNDSGQLEGGDALVAALLGNPSLATNSNQAQMLLQQLSNLNGQNNDCDGVRLDAEQLAASQMAMLNMLIAGGSAGNQDNNACGKDGAQSSAPNAMITGLDVTHNAIINAFNASNAGDLAQKPPRAKRRRSAPQGDPSMFNSTVSPSKYSRPRSAPGGANAVSQQFFPDVSNFAASSSSSELKSPSHAVTMVTSASSKSSVAVPGATGNQFEGMPPLSAAPCVTTVTSSIPQVISSTACVGTAQPTTATSTMTIPQQQQQQHLQNSVITEEQLNQLQQLSLFNPQLSTAHLTGAQLLELQQQLQHQLLNQQQQLFQGQQNQLVQQGGEDLQQQMGLLQQAMMNPMLLQQQLAQFLQTGGLSVDMLAQLQLSQMAMGGQLPDQALAQLVQANAVQQQNVADKDMQQHEPGNGEHNTSVEENPENNMEGNPDNNMEIGEQQANNSDENNKPAETMATVTTETSGASESSRPADSAAGKVATPSRPRQGEYSCSKEPQLVRDRLHWASASM